MSKTIVLPATLDTKGEEAAFIRDRIVERGHVALVIDVGVLGEPQIEPDITRSQIAGAGGKSLADLVDAARHGADRAEATNVMMLGLQRTVMRLHSEGRLDGIIAVGGSTGAAIATSAMSVLPVGVPKLMVGTWFETQFVGAKDVTIMQAPADMMGLNSVMRQVLASAAGAIVGMVEAEVPGQAKPLVGVTALGVTTQAVMNMRPLLEAMGLEAIVFHSKTQILDELIQEDRISGVIDLTTFEVMIPISFHLPEAMSAGRLALAGDRGLPQVIVPGGLDMFIFPGTKEQVPEEYRDRKVHAHGPDKVLVRTTQAEVASAAAVLAGRANSSAGPVAVVVPSRGFSAADAEGLPFHDPAADAAFIDIIRSKVKTEIEVFEVDAHINDEAFAREVVSTFSRLSKRGGQLIW